MLTDQAQMRHGTCKQHPVHSAAIECNGHTWLPSAIIRRERIAQLAILRAAVPVVQRKRAFPIDLAHHSVLLPVYGAPVDRIIAAQPAAQQLVELQPVRASSVSNGPSMDPEPRPRYTGFMKPRLGLRQPRRGFRAEAGASRIKKIGKTSRLGVAVSPCTHTPSNGPSR
jgi:hypothetical protein